MDINLKVESLNLVGVEVRFEGNYRLYSFKAFKELGLEEGNLVVVKTQHGLKVAEVANIHQEPRKTATRYVITKVDMEGHMQRRNIVNQRNAIKKGIKKRIQEVADERMLETLLPTDARLQELVEELKELNGGSYDGII